MLLWGVERLVTGLAAQGADHKIGQRLHVVLPGSPNRGRFGGDGAYGEAKAAFDAFVTRWHAEKEWAQRVSLAHAHIGWVRGTGLMGHNDPLVEAVTDQVRAFTEFATDLGEFAVDVLGHADAEARWTQMAAGVGFALGKPGRPGCLAHVLAGEVIDQQGIAGDLAVVAGGHALAGPSTPSTTPLGPGDATVRITK